MGDVVCLKDFASLQAAVDAVPENGTLLVPAGRWQCGAAQLKSNMTLFLEKGAELVAPENVEEHVDNTFFCRKIGISRCFIGLFNIENVTISGEGVLNGNGHLFWPGYDGAPDSLWRDPETGFFSPGVYSSVFPRPSLLIAFKSRNITIRDIKIRNSASYTVWCMGCRQLRVDGIDLKNIRRGPNTDGLDIDCCQDVWISDCRIDAGDDSIALKSDISALGEDMPCERIHVSNNTLSSHCCAIRLGYEGDGFIRDVIMTNNVIVNANIGLDMLANLPAPERSISFGIYKGAKIENIIVRGMVMRNVRQAIKLWNWVDKEETLSQLEGYIRNVLLGDMQIEACDASFIGGKSVSGIRLENIRMHVSRFENAYKDAAAVECPTVWGRGYMKEPLTLFHVPDIQLENVFITEDYQ